MSNDELEELLRETYAVRAERAAQAAGPQEAPAEASTSTASLGERTVAGGRRAATAVLVAAVLAGCAWAGIEIWEASRPVEGAFNPGQPLNCSGVRSLAPAAAEEELEQRGYDVNWQYHPRPGAPAERSRPPGDAVIIDITIEGDEALVLAEAFDAGDPLHRRIRAGESNCEDATAEENRGGTP